MSGQIINVYQKGSQPVSYPLILPIAKDPSLVGCWLFNERAGATLMDVSGNNNHGTITGADWVSGRNGSALNFVSASADVVNCGLAPALDFTTELFTVAFWIKRTEAGFKGLFSKRGTGPSTGFASYSNTFGTVYLEWYNVTAQSSEGTCGLTVANGWRHIVIVRDSATTVKFYSMGADVTSGGTAQNMTSPVGEDFNIGLYPTMPWGGEIDSFMVFNKALSAGEVKTLYESGI